MKQNENYYSSRGMSRKPNFTVHTKWVDGFYIFEPCSFINLSIFSLEIQDYFRSSFTQFPKGIETIETFCVDGKVGLRSK